MPNVITFDTYGFLNDTLDLDQNNWSDYFYPTIPDGVISGVGDEMLPYATSSGMLVFVSTGECRVRSHRGVLSQIKTLEIASADQTFSRIDLIVARVDYENVNMSIAVKTGTPSNTPIIPSITQNAGDIWEIPIAQVLVGAGVTTISADSITDRRFVYKTGNDSVYDFIGTTVSCSNDIEYRNAEPIDSLEITLPENPNNTFITGVNFTSSASFTGVTFKKGAETYTPKCIGDILTLISRRYNLVIWWDSGYGQFWCASKAVSA